MSLQSLKSPKGVTEHFAYFIATGAYSGLLPKAPGTWGTLVTVPLAYAIAPWTLLPKAFLWTGIFVIGTWSAAQTDRIFKSSDNQKIVVDEVVGYGIASLTCTQDWKGLAVAFVLFRLFDIVKPPPARFFDRDSKGKDNFWGRTGLGVMMDDVVAGFYALAGVAAAQFFLF